MSDASRARLNALKAKYHRGENLTMKEEKEFIGLIQSDQRSDGLLDKFRKDPNSLNSNERKEFLSYVDRYYIETITGKQHLVINWRHQHHPLMLKIVLNQNI